MSDAPLQLSADEILALKFAAHRQLARWAHKRDLSPRQRARRTVIARAVRTLDDSALAGGCELHVPGSERSVRSDRR
jgi:hypothetical protein